jgi:protein kinase A
MLSVDHPFLCKMDYMFQDELRLYFVMPFLKGAELYNVFQSMRRVSESTVKFWAVQIILAIGYLHEEKGIAHRDIKLENTLLDEYGYISIIDYGLAKKIDQKNLTYTFCGTSEYIAPEIWQNSGYGKEVDWWSIGIMIYELVIGFTPFYSPLRQNIA